MVLKKAQHKSKHKKVKREESPGLYHLEIKLSGNVIGSLVIRSRFESHLSWYATCGKSIWWRGFGVYHTVRCVFDVFTVCIIWCWTIGVQFIVYTRNILDKCAFTYVLSQWIRRVAHLKIRNIFSNFISKFFRSETHCCNIVSSYFECVFFCLQQLDGCADHIRQIDHRHASVRTEIAVERTGVQRVMEYVNGVIWKRNTQNKGWSISIQIIAGGKILTAVSQNPKNVLNNVILWLDHVLWLSWNNCLFSYFCLYSNQSCDLCQSCL